MLAFGGGCSNTQPLGPCPAGALGWEAEHTGCRGHRLLPGGICCSGPVMPEPRMGFSPELPVREQVACVPEIGRNGKDSDQGVPLGLEQSGTVLRVGPECPSFSPLPPAPPSACSPGTPACWGSPPACS